MRSFISTVVCCSERDASKVALSTRVVEYVMAHRIGLCSKTLIVMLRKYDIPFLLKLSDAASFSILESLRDVRSDMLPLYLLLFAGLSKTIALCAGVHTVVHCILTEPS